MKRFTFFPFYYFYVKYVGLAATLTGLVLTYFISPFYQALFYFGLFLIVFSREKNETEHIHHVRSEVFKSVFGLVIALGILLQLAEALTSFTLEITPFLYIGMPLMLYLLLFHTILVFRIKVSPDDTLKEHGDVNMKYYRFWFLANLLLILILILYTTSMI